MGIEITDLLGKSKMLNSMKAEQGAARLLKRIDNQEMGMEVLPNTYAQFTGELEEQDYISYCRFLNSVNGAKVIQILEEEDAGEFIEL